MVQDALKLIDPQLQTVLQLHFGLDGREPLTYKQIGKRFNLSTGRIQQIVYKALRAMRRPEVVQAIEAEPETWEPVQEYLIWEEKKPDYPVGAPEGSRWVSVTAPEQRIRRPRRQKDPEDPTSLQCQLQAEREAKREFQKHYPNTESGVTVTYYMPSPPRHFIQGQWRCARIKAKRFKRVQDALARVGYVKTNRVGWWVKYVGRFEYIVQTCQDNFDGNFFWVLHAKH